MEISNKLKKVIFKKLCKDLSHVDIIPYNDSIWFIDKGNSYWYFEFENDSKQLWWRYDFFADYFNLFSMEEKTFVPILSEWVENILNHKVNEIDRHFFFRGHIVEEMLNCNVETTSSSSTPFFRVEEILNCKVETTTSDSYLNVFRAEEVLNYNVETTNHNRLIRGKMVEEVLNCKVETTTSSQTFLLQRVEEVLNYKAETTDSGPVPPKFMIEHILNNGGNNIEYVVSSDWGQSDLVNQVLGNK